MHTYTYLFNPENKSDLSFDEFKEDFKRFNLTQCPPVINPPDGDYSQEFKIELKTFEDALLMYRFIDDHSEDLLGILPLVFMWFVFDDSIETEFFDGAIEDYKEFKKAAFYVSIQKFQKQVEERNIARRKAIMRDYKVFEQRKPFQETGGGIFNPDLFRGQEADELKERLMPFGKKGTVLELPDVGRDGRRFTGKVDPRIIDPEVRKEVD